MLSSLRNEDCYLQSSSMFELHDVRQNFETDYGSVEVMSDLSTSDLTSLSKTGSFKK